MGVMDSIMESGVGGRWFKFDKPGDSVQGVIESINERQVRDYTTKEPQFWKDGEPQVEVLFSIRTTLPREDEDDDGVRVVRIKGWGIQRNALRDACQKIGRAPQPGDKFRAVYTHDDNSGRGGFAAKVYEYGLKPGQQAPPQAWDPAVREGEVPF